MKAPTIWIGLAALAGAIVLGIASGPVPIPFSKTLNTLLWAAGVPVNVGFASIFMVTRPGLILRFNNEERR